MTRGTGWGKAEEDGTALSRARQATPTGVVHPGDHGRGSGDDRGLRTGESLNRVDRPEISARPRVDGGVDQDKQQGNAETQAEGAAAGSRNGRTRETDASRQRMTRRKCHVTISRIASC